jgi:DNA helicase-2/ATP-dependent DNA helicase PcrA
MRLHYVAFSRPQKLMVLTSTNQPKAHFNPIWEDLPQWPYIQTEILKAQRFIPKEFLPPKKAFSFTSHIKVYETCPRQYLYFKDYGFTPSRTAETLFGSLVHQTIEDIHRLILEGKPLNKVEDQIEDLFKVNYRHLQLSGLRPLSSERQEYALNQVNNYVKQNHDRIHHVVDTEVDVSLEKEDYILMGKVDLILRKDDRLELLDFKAQQRPPEGSPWLSSYHDQLLIYAHILEERYYKIPDRLVLYWTAEETREQAAMTFPYQHEKVALAGERFDLVAHQILNPDFKIRQYPEMKVCNECDLLAFCQPPGIKKRIE